MDEPYSQADHDAAVAIGGEVLLVATIVLIVGVCLVIAFF